MFLFLSKLLPLFVYPLGLACILLVVTLITLWQRPRIAALSTLSALLILVVSGNGWVANHALRSLEARYIPPTDLPAADAIVVLGGAVKPQSPPRPWIDLSEAGDRVIHGAQLYRARKAPLVVLSGGRIDWKGGGPSESEDMAKLAEALGVPRSAMLQDPTSLNTYENAVNVRKLLEERGIRQILLVTSALHMPRSIQIFRKQGFEAVAAPTDFWVTDAELQYSVDTLQAKLLNLIPDAENVNKVSRTLKEYIGLVVYRLRGWL